MEIEIRSSSNCFKIYSKKGNITYLHREDGPAIEYINGSVSWYYYDEKYYNPKDMPLNLFLAYCKWEYKKNGS